MDGLFSVVSRNVLVEVGNSVAREVAPSSKVREERYSESTSCCPRLGLRDCFVCLLKKNILSEIENRILKIIIILVYGLILEATPAPAPAPGAQRSTLFLYF